MTTINSRTIGLTAFLNAVFLTVPVFYFIYISIFPLIYSLLIFISKDDGVMFFLAFWIMEIILVFITTKYFKRIFRRVSKTVLILVSIISFSIFTVFGFNILPYHHNFPSRTISDIISSEENELKQAISKATNIHPMASFYREDKTSIETAFKNVFDTLKNVMVDTIVYDDSYLKYFVSIIFTTNSNEYYGQGFIGFRNNRNSVLKLYPFQHTTETSTTTSLITCKTRLRKIFFVDIRGVSQYLRYDDFVVYKYSPLDKEFWTTIFYTKGPDIDSLYYFQTERNFEKKNRTNIVTGIQVN